MKQRFKPPSGRGCLLYILLIAGAIFYLLPIYMLVATSLKSYAEVKLSTMWSIPGGFHLDSFRQAWFGDPTKGTLGLSSNFINSLKLAIPATIYFSDAWFDKWICVFQVEISRLRCAVYFNSFRDVHPIPECIDSFGANPSNL